MDYECKTSKKYHRTFANFARLNSTPSQFPKSDIAQIKCVFFRIKFLNKRNKPNTSKIAGWGWRWVGDCVTGELNTGGGWGQKQGFPAIPQIWTTCGSTKTNNRFRATQLMFYSGQLFTIWVFLRPSIQLNGLVSRLQWLCLKSIYNRSYWNEHHYREKILLLSATNASFRV